MAGGIRHRLVLPSAISTAQRGLDTLRKKVIIKVVSPARHPAKHRNGKRQAPLLMAGRLKIPLVAVKRDLRIETSAPLRRRVPGMAGQLVPGEPISILHRLHGRVKGGVSNPPDPAAKSVTHNRKNDRNNPTREAATAAVVSEVILGAMEEAEATAAEAVVVAVTVAEAATMAGAVVAAVTTAEAVVVTATTAEAVVAAAEESTDKVYEFKHWRMALGSCY